MENGYTILIPTRPQPDTIAAIFLLCAFGSDRFADIGTMPISVQIRSHLGPEESFDSLIAKKIIPLDVGGGQFDHHGGEYCTTELVAQYLDVAKNPALAQLIAWARRDDREGKGTLSRDPLDRAFGLSGMISALNKTHVNDPQKIVETVLPLLAAHYKAAHEHHIEMPAEVARKRQAGEYEEHEIGVQPRALKLAAIISEKPSMPTYLRSSTGPRADVVLQKSELKNHYCILTRQDRKVDLSLIAALIRLRESQLHNLEINEDLAYLGQFGRLEEVGMWYVDPATKSILNGGPHSPDVEESLIPWEEMKQIVRKALEMQ